LLPIFETLFKKVSYFKYAELTDHRAKLIRKMIQQAPGTFNHSIVVSNIAEACATAIGEDALLARTCAYYHDVGKLRRPEFFTENQADGNNPHDDLTPELSANIIKSHTQDGYQLIMKNRLPKEIADVSVQHHGTLPILYFYNKAKTFTDGDVDITQYCYAGPKPQSKIATIIMIADSCEAATRTLQDRSRENVKSVVRKIVNDRMALGQFEECEITLKELNIIIHTVVNSLTGVYHSRIEYPKVNLDGLSLGE
jgi:putative nucleotidyltransferase with HDIG domain